MRVFGSKKGRLRPFSIFPASGHARPTFEGIGAQIVYSTGPEGQSFSAQIDGQKTTAFSYSDVYSYGNVLPLLDLPAGQHTLTVTNGDGALWIEAVLVQGELCAPVEFVPTPSPPPPGALALPPAPLAAESAFSDGPLGEPEALAVAVPYVVVDDSASLMVALNRANAEGPLAIYMEPGQYVLSDTHFVWEDTYLYGRGQEATIITGPSGKHLFHITAGVTFELTHAKIEGASTSSYGGAIFNQGHLIISDSTLHNNQGGNGGGAIFNNGVLEIFRTLFDGNSAGGGGAIQNDQGGVLEITCTKFEANVSGYAAVLQGQTSNSSGTISITNSAFVGNTAVEENPRDLVKLEPSGEVKTRNVWFDSPDHSVEGAITFEDNADSDPTALDECQPVPAPEPLTLSISKTVNESEIGLPVLAATETQITFTIRVSNDTTTPMDTVVVVDQLPEALNYISDDADGSYDSDLRQITWTVDAPAEQQQAITVTTTIAAGIFPGAEIVNIAQIESIEGNSVEDLVVEKTIVPVVCYGHSNADNINVREQPSLDASSVTQISPDKTVGVIGITYSPDNAEHPLWYRIAIPVDEEEENPGEVDEPFQFGWITASLFDSDCGAPVLDHSANVALVPDQARHERLAFTQMEEGVFTKEQIAEITNWRDPNNPPPVDPVATLVPGTPVVVTGIHPNRQYVRIGYRDDGGTDNHWIKVREYNQPNFEDLVAVNYESQEFNSIEFAVMPLEDVADGTWRALLINDRPELEALVLSESELPTCTGEQVVNCVPPGAQQECHEIFGCNTVRTALILNKFKDEEDGCSEGRCSGACGEWANFTDALAWHCGIDLVTQRDVEYDDTDARSLYTVQGGLISGYYLGNEGGHTLKVRHWAAGPTELYEIHEDQYVHLELNGQLAQNPEASSIMKRLRPELVGQYLPSGSLIGNYAPLGLWGEIDPHVHYVQKNFWAPQDTEVILPANLTIRNYGDGDRTQYEVPAGFAGTNEITSRYVPIDHPGYEQSSVWGQDDMLTFSVVRWRGTLSYEQENLPAGLNIVIDGDANNPIITGTVTATPGTYDVTVIVTDDRADYDRTGHLRMQWIVAESQTE